MSTFREADHKLSMRISPRARDGKEPQRDMRSLLVHRLRQTPKAVLRLSNSRDLGTAVAGDYSMYCEPCGRFFPSPDWDDDWICPQCERYYVTEMVIMSAVEEDK